MVRLNLSARLYQALVGASGLGLLFSLSLQAGIPGNLLAVLVFIALSIVVKRAGYRIVPEATHSLVGVVDLAALLIFGPLTGAWVAATSEAVYLALHAFRRQPFHPATHLGTPLFNAGLKALMALLGGWVYTRLGGTLAPTGLTAELLLPLTALILIWFLLDHLAWLLRVALTDGLAAALDFIRHVWLASLAIELVPLPFAPVMAIVYTVFGPVEFAILAMMLVAVSLLINRQGIVQQQLNDRITELTTFHELGQEIVGAQMDLKRLADLAYSYTTRIVGDADFRLVLVDQEKNTLRPVLWAVDGQRRAPETMPLDGVERWLREARQALLIDDTRKEAVDGVPLAKEARSGLAVPLMAGRDVIGGMLIQSDTPRAFRDAQLRLLSTLGSQLAVGVENARLYEREWKRAIQLSAISEVSRQVAAIINLDELFSVVVQLVQASFGYDYVQVLTVHEDEVLFRASTGPVNWARRQRGYARPLGEGIIGTVARSGEPLLANDVTKEPRYVLDPEVELHSTRSELAVPLRVEARTVGVLDVQSNRVDAFDKDDLFVLQTLADQIAIAIEEARLYEEALARQRLEQELSLASEVQSSLLPEFPPDIPGWQVAAFWRPAREMAGDFYDFVSLTEGRWGFIIADVSDKGVAAALFMAVSRSLVRASVLGRRTPAEALMRANNLLLKDTRTDMFVTLFYTLLDPATGRMTYVNAGHNPPLMYRHATGETEALPSRGIVLGAVEAIVLDEYTAQMHPGDVLVMYTDGITEAIDNQENDFGEERLAEVIRATHAMDTASIIGAIIAAVTRFTDDAPQFDDFALVVIKREVDSAGG